MQSVAILKINLKWKIDQFWNFPSFGQKFKILFSSTKQNGSWVTLKREGKKKKGVRVNRLQAN